MNFLQYILIIILTIAISTTSVFAQKERKSIRKGNDIYEKALGDSGYVDTIRMQNAELYYRKALDKEINSFEGGFNLGASLFKQQKFSESVDQYKILTSSVSDKDKLGKVYHNLGNSLLMDGKLQESIDAYKSSLRNNPTDTATKYNLAAAQKLLKEAEENPDKQEQQQDQQEESEDQEKQEKQEQQENKDQEKQEKEQQQAEEDKENEEGEEKEAARPDEISKEDAERILKAIQQDEKELQEKLKKEKAKAKKIRVEKEW